MFKKSWTGGLFGVTMGFFLSLYSSFFPHRAMCASLDATGILGEYPNIVEISPAVLQPAISTCPDDLTDPVVEFIGTENYTANGKKWVRYLLSVTNRDQYPDYLFNPAPNLPACGLNTNSARTWVDIVDQDENYIYGFCALGSSGDLDGLWFAVEEGEEPPPGIKVILRDRYCKEEYASGLVKISPESFAPPPRGDLELRSRWASMAPVVDGVVSAGEWDQAGSLVLYDISGLKRGVVLVKNDDTHLYVLLDMTSDQVDDNATDYSGLAFDIGTDGVKSPYVDLRFASTSTGTFGVQWVVSDTGWTGIHSGVLTRFAKGFGTSPNETKKHRIFEYQVDLSEIGIDFNDVLAGEGPIYQARMSVEAVSGTPSFRVYYPSHYNSYANPMIRIALDMGSLNVTSTAPIIAGIGLVPRTFIDDTTGLATTGPSDQFPDLKDAPFGGHLRVIGNVAKLSALGIKYYAIGYCNMDLHGCSSLYEPGFDLGQWEFVQDTRTNYYWDGQKGKYVLEAVGPETIFDAGGYLIKAYPILDPGRSWYMPNLLFDWRTTGSTPVNSGKYKIHFFGFSDKNIYTFVPTAPDESTMVVTIDNTRPVLSINYLSYKGSTVGACSIVRLDDLNDTLEINISAYDPDGYLKNFSLHALYGSGQSFTCHQETYEGYLSGGGTGPEWAPAMPTKTFSCQGDAGDHWETTCGYTFRITGWDRAINGYGHIHYSSDHETITILTPDYGPCY